MKKYAILSILGLVLMCFPYLGNAQESQKENPDPTTKIEVIDFYGTLLFSKLVNVVEYKIKLQSRISLWLVQI